MGSNGSRPSAAYLLLPVFDTGVFLSKVLPPRVGDWICRRGGDVLYAILPARRKVTAENFAVATGKPASDPSVLRLVRESFRNYGSYLYDTVRFSHIPTQEMLDRVVPHDEHYLFEALERGKGVIFVSAHFGSMELAAVTVAKRVAPMTIAGTALKPAKLMDKLIRQRAERGIHLSVHAGAARDVLSALKRNETVGFLVDLGASWKGQGTTMVNFFGRPAPFPAGIALLALRSGAAIVPGYALSGPNGRVDAHALPAIIPQPTGDKEADAQRLMQQVVRSLEGFIAQHPEQWYMYRPMWPATGESTSSSTIPTPAALAG